MKLLFVTNLKKNTWMMQTLWGQRRNEITCPLWIGRFQVQKLMMHLAGL